MKIVYMINARCNAQCPHCYRKTDRSDLNHEKSPSQCEYDINQLLRQGHEVIVAGAETLCSPEKLWLYQVVNQKYILSNGIALAENKNILKTLILYGIERIQISWHFGFPELSKSITERITLRAIDNVQQAGLVPQISCVISNRNFDKLNDIAESLIKNGIKEIKFLQLLPTNSTITPYLLNRDQRDKFLEQIVRIRKLYPKEKLLIKIHPNFNSALTDKSIDAKRKGLFCPAGKEFVVIETNGNIYPCPFLANEKMCIGTMDNGMLKIRRKINHDGKNCLANKYLTKIL